VQGLQWNGPVFQISGLSGEGTRELRQAIMQRLEVLQNALPLQLPEESEQKAGQ